MFHVKICWVHEMEKSDAKWIVNLHLTRQTHTYKKVTHAFTVFLIIFHLLYIVSFIMSIFLLCFVVLSFTYFSIGGGGVRPNSQPYYEWCDGIQPWDSYEYQIQVGFAFNDLLEHTSNSWPLRKDHPHGGKSVQMQGWHFFSTQDPTTCSGYIRWRGGCRESNTCLLKSDCRACLYRLTQQTIDVCSTDD